MTDAYLIYNALVLTLEPGRPPLTNGYVVVEGDKIAAVGQAATVAELPSSRQALNAQGGLVMPGLVNTHIHAAMTLFRGLADDLPLQEWLQEHMFPTEERWVEADFVYWGTMLAAAELIRGGTTTLADSYFYAQAARQAIIDAGLRGVLSQGILDFPFPGVPQPQENLKVATEFIDSGDQCGSNLVTSSLFCHAPYTCRPDTLQKAKDITRARRLPFFIHLAETRQEVEQMRRQTGLSPTAYLGSLGVLDELTVAAHAVWVDEADQEILAHNQVKVCHCPESNLKLAAGIAPIPALISKGVTVGLGTDGAASNNNLDMFGEMNLAAKIHKVRGQDPTLLPAAGVVALATRGGAEVLGLSERIGTLTPGKAADLIVIDLNQPHLTPLYDPHSHLVYTARAADVRHLMVNGRWLMVDRQLLSLDWPQVRQQTQSWARKIRTGAN
jgi:5-methylthioadenosine/S-adenosylhomocysteine deaminase